MASLSPGDASGGAEGGTRGAGGHEWSLVSRNFGFPALADSSAIPYGSDRIGQKGRSACAEPQPPSTTALTFAVAVSMCRSAPVCGPQERAGHRWHVIRDPVEDLENDLLVGEIARQAARRPLGVQLFDVN